MSIVADIKRARAEYEDHLATHACGELTKCPERAAMLVAWFDTAHQWGLDPDDHTRQEEHYRRNVESKKAAL